uniref:Uncharacterized protein n=1 Tax=Panagrolaimus sp. ES5 TaxID=591445 RepID=A0AC34FH19_9BILA
MAEKNRFVAKKLSFVDSRDAKQFTNLNLNLNNSHRCSSVTSIRSQSNLPGNKKINNYDFVKPLNYKDDKSLRPKPSAYLNVYDSFEDEKSNKDNHNASHINIRTISLHILEYENSVDATSDSDEKVVIAKSKNVMYFEF